MRLIDRRHGPVIVGAVIETRARRLTRRRDGALCGGGRDKGAGQLNLLFCITPS